MTDDAWEKRTRMSYRYKALAHSVYKYIRESCASELFETWQYWFTSGIMPVLIKATTHTHTYTHFEEFWRIPTTKHMAWIHDYIHPSQAGLVPRYIFTGKKNTFNRGINKERTDSDPGWIALCAAACTWTLSMMTVNTQVMDVVFHHEDDSCFFLTLSSVKNCHISSLWEKHATCKILRM